jgi:surfactin synthase thioesterase subunit
VVDDPWFRSFRPAPDRPIRVVCFPHAGGSASAYLKLAVAVDTLDAQAEMVIVQYPGRHGRMREPARTDLLVLAEEITEALAARFTGPIALFGHSMGAAVAFEVARGLERLGREPLRLFASGCRAPSLGRDEDISRLDDAALIAEMAELGGTDPRLLAEEEILRMALPAIRADYTAIVNYRTAEDARVSCPITALTGDDDPRADLASVRAWAKHTSAEFDLRVYPGAHFYLMDQIPQIAEEIGKGLTG